MGQMVNPTPVRTQAAQRVQIQDNAQISVNRSVIFLHALAFVFGFGLIFTLLGSAAGFLGQNSSRDIYNIETFLRQAGAILVLLFGLATMGVFRRIVQYVNGRPALRENPAVAFLTRILDFFNGLLYTERRVIDMHKVNRDWGYFSSILIGISFGAGWTACIGPILGSILFLAGDSSTVVQGATLLAIYSIGLGIPFLVTGMAFGAATKTLRRLNRYTTYSSILSGLFLIAVAILLWRDELALLTTQFTFLTDWILQLDEVVSSLFGMEALGITNINVLSAAPLAFFAGILSFLSPCVLPLVPAYIGYLSGASLNTR